MELHRRRQGLIADRRSCTNLATTTEIDYSAFDALTFDCYGTLIDWETGILAGLWAALAAHRVDGTGDELLGGYADAEATLENGVGIESGFPIPTRSADRADGPPGGHLHGARCPQAAPLRPAERASGRRSHRRRLIYPARTHGA
jgi:hypothetical protein